MRDRRTIRIPPSPGQPLEDRKRPLPQTMEIPLDRVGEEISKAQTL